MNHRARPALQEEACFRPVWWLRSPHIQTIWPFLFRRRVRLDLNTELFELADGDVLELNWSRQQDRQDKRKIVLLIHGLEGSLDSHYAAGLMHTLQLHNYRPVFMHFRGCNGQSNRLPRAYHSGDTADIAAVVSHIQEKTGKPVYAAIGFSLGANALLKWLGETGLNNPLEKAVAVSVPFRLADAVERLNKGFSVFYRTYLLRSLCNSYRRKFSKMPSPLKIDIKNIKSLRQYDDEITAPLHGFDSAEHYYQQSSCRQYLKSIRTPTCIIHASDDPFMYRETIPPEKELSETIKMLVSGHGGHVGFVRWRFPFKFDYWHEHKIIEFLDAAETCSALP